MNCPQCGHSNAVDCIECEDCGELLVDVFEQTSKISISFDRPNEVSFETHETSSHTQELSAGSLIGNRYEILGLIGEGGMGRVFKVRDLELDKIVALKLIRAEQAKDPANIQRFKQELILARQITHKNVVRIYDFGEANGFKFFTMEWIDGESLRDSIRRRGKVSPEEALPLARQMLEALQEAHREGVVHRDLKPHNVMIDHDGTPRILDFGIARAADTNTMTATGAVMGTPDYMSPEQACGEKAGPQSDLYSLGVILYEMLTGELPFQAESPMSRIVMRLTKKPATPRELNGELPDYLERIVLKCMEVDLELRYQSADEILRDLDREQVDRSVGLKVRLAAARHKTALAVAAALVAATAVGFYAVNEWRSYQAQPAPEVPVATLSDPSFHERDRIRGARLDAKRFGGNALHRHFAVLIHPPRADRARRQAPQMSSALTDRVDSTKPRSSPSPSWRRHSPCSTASSSDQRVAYGSTSRFGKPARACRFTSKWKKTPTRSSRWSIKSPFASKSISI